MILTGCSFSTLNYDRSGVFPRTPPPFSFLDQDPNNIDILRLERMRQYDSIIKSSPIPVFVIYQKDLPQIILEDIFKNRDPNQMDLYGLFVEDSADASWPKSFIFINKNASAEKIITTYFHEYQHYKCKKTGCFCSNYSVFSPEDKIIASIIREKHALLNELRRGLEMRDEYLVQNTIESIVRYILNDGEYTYKLASISIVYGEIWNKAIDFLIYIKGLEKKVR